MQKVLNSEQLTLNFFVSLQRLFKKTTDNEDNIHNLKQIVSNMAKLDLTQYGITGSTVIAHNPSYEYLFEEETMAGLEGFDKGVNTELNAVNVMTGIYTGRSPKDKYIVKDAQSQDKVWWTSEEYKNDNHLRESKTIAE